MKNPSNDDTKQGWKPPTRRTFVHMLAAAAAALAVRDRSEKKPPIWIGHF